MGALIRYTSVPSAISHVEVRAVRHTTYNGTLPPDYLWYHMKRKREYPTGGRTTWDGGGTGQE